MKVAFVYRGYGENVTNSVIDFQRLSLVKAGLQVETFPVKGGGLKNYLNAIFKLRKYVKRNKISLLHAHYSFSGFIAGLAGVPVICSLMGSDVLKAKTLFRFITSFFYTFIWKVTIVKSKEMHLLFPKSQLIPNGVDFDNFRPIAREQALEKTGFNPSDINIVFIAEDPNARVKNIALANQGIKLSGITKIKLHAISGKGYAELPYYYCAADLLILTSLSEGSPNVIKEAMACNCPIVSTDVGDVRQVIGATAGCFITNFEAEDVAAKLKLALAFGKRTNGRDAIQHLDSKVIAGRIIEIYKKVLGNRETRK